MIQILLILVALNSVLKKSFLQGSNYLKVFTASKNIELAEKRPTDINTRLFSC